MRFIFIYIFLSINCFVVSQNDSLRTDSIKKKGNKNINLTEVEVVSEKDNSFGISRLNNVEGTTIYAGKK